MEKTRKHIACWLIVALIVAAIGFVPLARTQKAAADTLVQGSAGDHDVVVYGATSAGVTAAIAAKREGADVLLIAQNSFIGGLTASGLGATDMANKSVVGGISWEFYNRVYEYYKDSDAWTSETEQAYYDALGKGIYGGKNDSLAMQWVFEPKVAQKIFVDMLIEEQVPVIFNEPIDLQNGVEKEGERITAIVSESGKRFTAKVFIDCSYEGDLMALADVTYTVGREANEEYGETMNGILPNANEYAAVSPYIVEGDPDSGLLPFIEDKALGVAGDADSRVQAYCFRFTLTTDPNNRVPITKPENYHPEWYETRARILQANPAAGCELTQNRMPNNKTDTNHADFVGMSYEYANGDYLSRKKIEDDHRDYVLGILYFYAYDERVPQAIRDEMRTYGLARDEFTDNGNFPVQIYLREGRRMVSDYVMSESDVITTSVPGVIQKTTAPYSVGQGFYWFDSHRVAYFKVDSAALGTIYQTDGNFWASRRDYPISYQSIRPKREECVNLYVPVCLSSTHAAYGSIRMETTYMIVGESAGTAAAMSAAKMETEPDFCVQDLDYATLAAKLSLNGQLLGDIVAPDMGAGTLVVLKLGILNLLTEGDAQILTNAIDAGAIDTPEAVQAVQNTFVNAAKRIVKDSTKDTALAVLNKFGIISNTNAWAPLFADPLPPSLNVSNVVSLFDKTVAFFADESPLGYITDWVNYFHENGIIDETLRDYFDDNAVSGKTCEGEKIAKLAVAVAKTLDPSVTTGSDALQIFVNTGITGNAALWAPVFNGEANQSGSTVSGLLKNTYAYLTENESDWKGVRIAVVCLDALLARGVVEQNEYVTVLRATADSATLAAATAKSIAVRAAQQFDGSADETNALTVLQGVGIDVDGIDVAWDGTAVAGNKLRAFLTALQVAIAQIPSGDPLESEVMEYFVAAGIATQDNADYFNENAVAGKTVDRVRLMNMLERVSSRVTASGNIVEKLYAVGAIDETTKNALMAGAELSTVNGAYANVALTDVHAYMLANGETLSAQYVTLLTEENIVAQGDIATVQAQISQFGYPQAATVQSLFIGLARRVDASATDIDGALAVLSDINAVGNADNWATILESGEGIVGKDCLTVTNVTCRFIAGTLADYEYLAEKGHITAEQKTYFIRHGNNSNTAEVAKLKALFVSIATPLDSAVTDATSAVNALKDAGIIGNANAWLNIVNSTEQTVVVSDLINLVEKTVDELQRRELSSGAQELSDELLTYFTSHGYISGTTFNAAWFKEQAKAGNTVVNKIETQNMLVRAFRAVWNNKSLTAANVATKLKRASATQDLGINGTLFTFSNDQTEHAELTDYWVARFSTTTDIPDIDGEKLRVLMERIYDYLTQEAA